MFKCPVKIGAAGLFLWSSAFFLGPQDLVAADASSPDTGSPNALSATLLQRAQDSLDRIRPLVEQGTLSKSRLAEAEEQLADIKDQVILDQTLYGVTRIQDMTPEQGQAMLQAAQRRVDRQEKIVDDRNNLVAAGILARSEFAAYQDELDSRKRVLDLAQNRIQLMNELKQMAETEQNMERALSAASTKDVMIRYDGNGLFNLTDLTTISAEFERRFHHSLPISALGQTLVHQSMGLDHRNRVDVALNPDQPEGLWLRQFLEHSHTPYIAFRSAVAGAATAPHIHIGPESTRLKLAER